LDANVQFERARSIDLVAPIHPDAKPVSLRVSESANVALSGIQAGWLVGSQLVSGPKRRSLDYPAYVAYQQDFLKRTGKVAPLFMPATVTVDMTTLLLLRKQPRGGKFWLTTAGLACNVGVMAAALFFNLPANNAVNSWSADSPPPSNWRDVRDQFETGQQLRMIFAVGAFVASSAAAIAF
jgi:hypothetical protein